MDLRSTLSKQYISEALIALLQVKEYNKISIQDIVDKAGLSRITYYRNFNNKDEIIIYYLEENTQDFFNRLNINVNQKEWKKYIEILFKDLLDEKKLLLAKTLIKADLTHYIKNEIERVLTSKTDNQRDLYKRLFIAGGIFNVYIEWVSNGCKETPEEMSNILNEYFERFNLHQA